MCGICGIVNFKGAPISKDLLRQMNNTLIHRGPDEEGYYFNQSTNQHSNKLYERNGPGVALAHRRLSIIDLAAGHQPMCNEDGSIWIVFNGEIYNFQEINAILEKKGHKFKTRSDTETIIHAYEEYGIDCLKYFNGMFAFAIWDEKAKTLFLARDRLGIKPLLYYYDQEKFIFASELKAILQYPNLPKEIDLSALNLYLFFGYVPAPLTILKNVYKLLPGHYLKLNLNTLEIQKYWDVSPSSYVCDEETAQRYIKEILRDAVKKRLISDVPLGVFLSGGLDSSTVACLMASMVDNPIKTFTIGFKETAFDESQDARVVAQHINSEHYELIIEPEDCDILPKLVWFLDEPFADSSALPTYYISKLASEYVKVVLAGDGGDELFGGYKRYLETPAEKLAYFLPLCLAKTFSKIGKILPEYAKGKYFLEALDKRFPETYLDKIGTFPDLRHVLYENDLQHTIGEEYRYFTPFFKERKWDQVSKILSMTFFDLKMYLPNDILIKVDRMSMAHSLEARVPILDYRLVEFAFKINPLLKIREGETKYLFKKTIQGIVPKHTLKKKKQGFGVPIGKWFRGNLFEYVYDILLDPKTKRRGYFKTQSVNNLIREHKKGTRDYSYWLWTLVILELWHRVFLDENQSASSCS